MMAPRRFVRRSSTSPFASVSVFSGKLGADSAGVGKGEVAATGNAEALGDVAAVGELPGVGDAASGAGCGGGKCEAVYAYQAINPMTQPVMATQAWRSIIVARRAIHRQSRSRARGCIHCNAAEPDRARVRPTDCSGPGGKRRARVR